MSSTTRTGTALALCSALLFAAPAAAAPGWLDALFGRGGTRADADKAGPRQRVWAIHDFTTVALVPREAGSAANPQALPLPVQPEGLRQQLAQVQWAARDGMQPLFAADELAELVGPLSQALTKAGLQDDVLLLSSSRRDAGILGEPTAVTARLFMQGEQLQLIVHDARFEFYDRYRGTWIDPHFSFGSRTATSKLVLRSAGASNVRADWLSIPLKEAGPAATAAPAAAGAPAAPAALTAPASGTAVTAPAAIPPPTPAPRKPLDAAGAEDIERRLETLKRLRDRNLITEEEYQQKRKEILQSL